MNFPDFNSIKQWFEMNLWTKSMVGDGVVCKKITAEQYKVITGEDYQVQASNPQPESTSESTSVSA
ncbi:XkdX family protein [Pediococcus stilesii]|uniref:XkdX family protein n=2 Tax=Pediococcus stilesii TaxID=331679 RepID=A0A5R9BS64_9LACO|nr:XkdX family protein [Pediococcus stilesii]